MKILLVHNYYRYRGGEETYFNSLSNILRAKQHKIITFTKDSRNIKNSFLSKFQIGKNLFYSSKVADDIKQLIIQTQPDIAHINNIYPLITPTVFKILKTHSVPIIQTIHNYRFFCPKGTLFRDGHVCEQCVHHNFPYPSILHGCYQSSRAASLAISSSILWNKRRDIFDLIDHFIFPSSLTYRYYLNHAPDIKLKSSIIPHFVSSNNKSSIRQNYFLYVGRLSEEKGILELLKIFLTLKQFKLIILGEGPLSIEIQSKYKKYNNIKLLGNKSHDETLKYISEAKCLIISSKWFEVLPMVYIEALSCGTPVLAPKTDVFSRVIEKSDVFYYPFNNFTALKNQIFKINSIPNFSSYKFYKEYKNCFTPEKHLNKLMEIYAKISNKN